VKDFHKALIALTIPLTILSMYGFILFMPIDSTVVVVPIFTASAYQPSGFYDYYCTSGGLSVQTQAICKEHNQTCTISCLTMNISRKYSLTSSLQGIRFLGMIQTQHFITDIDVVENPSILSKYKKVIVLHNEYVTWEEFKAITQHPRVIMLYADAFRAEVTYDKTSNTITLVKGHGFNGAQEAFNWPRGETPTKEERDTLCMNQGFKTIFEKVTHPYPPTVSIRYLPCFPEDVWLNHALWVRIKMELMN